MNNNDFLNLAFNLFGKPKSKEPNPAELFETPKDYNIIALYSGKVSSVVIHYQKMC